jgi:NADPH:quinone reductase-like Zn-dependent oxidoreductase
MRVDRERPGTLLVVAAAGGVGSILVQFARRLTRLTVVGTASRAESAAFARRMGAHHVSDHRRPFVDGLGELERASDWQDGAHGDPTVVGAVYQPWRSRCLFAISRNTRAAGATRPPLGCTA